MNKAALFCVLLLILPPRLLAAEPVSTFSIVGCDPENGKLGVAVASKYFAVGSVVPWAKAGVGAVATQAWVNYDYGIIGLELLDAGMTPQQVIDSLISADPGAERRQVGIIDFMGNTATYTGSECLHWAGGQSGENCVAQGNILVSDTVVTMMVEAFEKTNGDLADKLMAALLAGDSAGGDSRGKQSAALYVVSATEGLRYDREIDIRVDDSPEPFEELRRLFGIARALSHLDAASHYYQAGEIQMAVREARKAVELGPDIPETYYDLACYLTLAGRFDEALVSIETAIKLAPLFKNMAIGDSDLDGLRSFPEFQQLLK
jgi:uncharacterized Ntn-hydrolase superfamily protein